MKISLKPTLPLLAAAVSLFSCDKLGDAIDDDIDPTTKKSYSQVDWWNPWLMVWD